MKNSVVVGLFPLDKTNICMYFIKGPCRHQGEWNHLSTVVFKHFGKTCFHPQSVALRLMTRWQVREDDQWTALPDNEMIEKDYCDPKKTCRYSSKCYSLRFCVLLFLILIGRVTLYWESENLT